MSLPICGPISAEMLKFFFLGNSVCCLLPSVLWRCWLGSRKGIRPVKNWVVGYWHGYLSGARCRLFAYGPADATAIPKPPSSLASFKSRLVLPFWYQLTQVVLVKRPLNGCSVVVSLLFVSFCVHYFSCLVSCTTESDGCIGSVSCTLAVFLVTCSYLCECSDH